MTDWTDGYVCDIDYTQGFYRELTPSHLAFCLLLKGIRPPPLAAPLRYCELGAGQGVSSIVIAAANPDAEVWATDFNPSHAANARHLAGTAALGNARFFDKSFAEFLEFDTPDFDVITLHGVYSWVSAENRATIVEFIRRKLKPGGVVYVSYNCLPGWLSTLPLRTLMAEHAARSNKAVDQRIDDAIAFAGQVAGFQSGYFAATADAAMRLESLKGAPRNYLAHEYFNRDWKPHYFFEVQRELAAAKLTFAASANLGDHIEALNLSPDAQAFVAGIGDDSMRQTVRDYLINQKFRRDIYVRGASRLSAEEQNEQLLATRFALVVPRSAVPRTVKHPAGELKLQHENYIPVLDALAEGPATLGDLMVMEGVGRLGLPLVLQALIALSAAGVLAPGLPVAGEAGRLGAAAGFNAAILDRARFGSEMMFLASTVTGGGVQLSRVDQLILLASRRGVDPVAFILPILIAQGEALVRDGTVLTTMEDNQAQLRSLVDAFNAERLPQLRRLGIA